MKICVTSIVVKKKKKKILKAFSRSIRMKHGRVLFSRITMTRSRTDGVADTVPQAARGVTPGIMAITCTRTIWWVDQHKFDHRTLWDTLYILSNAIEILRSESERIYWCATQFLWCGWFKLIDFYFNVKLETQIRWRRFRFKFEW